MLRSESCLKRCPNILRGPESLRNSGGGKNSEKWFLLGKKAIYRCPALNSSLFIDEQLIVKEDIESIVVCRPQKHEHSSWDVDLIMIGELISPWGASFRKIDDVSLFSENGGPMFNFEPGSC